MKTHDTRLIQMIGGAIKEYYDPNDPVKSRDICERVAKSIAFNFYGLNDVFNNMWRQHKENGSFFFKDPVK